MSDKSPTTNKVVDTNQVVGQIFGVYSNGNSITQNSNDVVVYDMDRYKYLYAIQGDGDIMKSETLKRYKVSESELLKALGIEGKLSFITTNMDDSIIIEVLVGQDGVE